MTTPKATWEVTDCSGSTMHLTVRITRRLKVRMWIACRLIRLAARVLRCGLDVAIEETENK